MSALNFCFQPTNPPPANNFSVSSGSANALTFGKKLKTPTSLDTKFSELLQENKDEIGEIHTRYRKPLRDILDQLQRTSASNQLSEMRQSLSNTSIAADKLESKQETLLRKLNTLREVVRTRHQMTERFGNVGLQQIQRTVQQTFNESLPIELYRDVRLQLEQQVNRCTEEAKRLVIQLEASNSQGSQVNSTGAYGERMRVGPHDLLELMQRQNEAFIEVAARVADIHEKADRAIEAYKNKYNDDPFAAQDKREAMLKLDVERRAKENIKRDLPQIENNGATFTAGLTNTTTPATSAFGAVGAPAASPFGSFGAFGAFGAPSASAFGAVGAPSASAFGAVGAPAASAFGAVGAPAASAFGAFGAPSVSAVGAPAASAFGAFGAVGAPAASAFGAVGAPAVSTFGAPAATSFGASGFGATNFNFQPPQPFTLGQTNGINALDLSFTTKNQSKNSKR